MKENRAAALDAAKEIADRVKAAGRSPTADERVLVDAYIKNVDDLDVQIKAAKVDEDRFARMAQLSPAAQANPSWFFGDGMGNGPRSGGHLFDEGAKVGVVQAVKSRQAFRTTVDSKALLVGSTLPTAGVGVSPGVYPTAIPLAALFPNQPADGPSVRFYVMGGATAAVVAEGGTKPDSGLTITPRDVTIEKIATTVRFSDEFADDAPYLLSYLSAELSSAVVVRENAEILSTFSLTSGVNVATGTKATAIDVFADTIATQEAVNGQLPTALIVSPVDLAVVRKAKASTGGEYFIDPLAATPASIHGVPLVSSAVVAAGTAWLVTGSGVVIYRRGPITVDIGHNGTDWQENMSTMRVEERFQTAVVRPSMLTKITLT